MDEAQGGRTPRCPACATVLTRRFGDFAAWECPHAHGMAATLPVARQRVAGEAVGLVWRRSAEAPPGARPCPFCQRSMVTVELVVTTTAPPVRLDLCRVDQLLWFDPGEIEALPPRTAADDRPAEPIIVNHWANATDDLPSAGWIRPTVGDLLGSRFRPLP